MDDDDDAAAAAVEGGDGSDDGAAAAAVAASSSSPENAMAMTSSSSSSPSASSAPLQAPPRAQAPAAVGNPKSDDDGGGGVTAMKTDADADVAADVASDDVQKQCYLLTWLPRYFLQTSVFPVLHPSDLGAALSLCGATSGLSRDVWGGRLSGLEVAAANMEAAAAEAADDDDDGSVDDAGAGAGTNGEAEANGTAHGDAGGGGGADDDAGEKKKTSVRTLKRLYRRKYFQSKPMFEDEFTGHAARISTAAPLTDTTFVTASHDGTLRSWDMTTGAVLRTFLGHTGKVHGVAAFDDAERPLDTGHGGSTTTAYFVSCGGDRMGKPSAKLWDAKTGTCLRTFIGHADDVMAVVRLPRSNTGTSRTGSNGRTNSRRRRSSAKKRGGGGSGPTPSSPASSSPPSPSHSSPRFVTAGLDASCKIWNAATGECVGGCFGGGADGFVTLATVGGGGQQQQQGGGGAVYVTGDTGGGLSVWRDGSKQRVQRIVPSARQLMTGGGQNAAAAAAAVGAGQAVAAAAAAARAAAGGSLVGPIECGDGSSVLVCRGRQLSRYHVLSGEIAATYTLTVNDGVPGVLAMVRMDRRLYVMLSRTPARNEISLWDIGTGRVVHRFDPADRPVFSLSRLNEVTFVLAYVDGAMELRRIPEEFLVRIDDNDNED